MKTRNFLSILIAVSSLSIVTAAMIIEPSGEIHYSVNLALTVCLTYSAGLQFGKPKKTNDHAAETD